MSKHFNVHPEGLSPSKPLPRYKRRRRRPAEDRGLAPDADLQQLAEIYLQQQRKHWPDLAKSGLLAKPSAAVLADMVEDFKQRHRKGRVDPSKAKELVECGLKLAGSYNRYSCDNSNPHSISDQMVSALQKARAENRFVPWTFVFADFSVSGLDHGRRGFGSYKLVLENPSHEIETTYIDDFTRASRDDIEWWKLANLTRRLHKRLIGASDGFDLSSPMGEMMISVYLLISRLFIKQLREKVSRGMRGGARRRTCLGKPPLGLTRRAKRDDTGRFLRNADGSPVYELCHDPVTMQLAQLIFELFVMKHWSIGKIVRHFNEACMDDWDGWTSSGIRGVLRNPVYIGVVIWNRFCREYDEEKEQWVKMRNPRSEWEVNHDKDLALISMDWWRTAQRKLAESKKTGAGRRRTRNQSSASTLFSGTLVCEHCERELTLYRSAGKHRSMFCLNGASRAHACKLTTSKSTRIIETCLLKFLQETLLTNDVLQEVVRKANAYLAAEAARPRIDTKALRTERRKKEATIKKLFDRVASESDEHICAAYDQQIGSLRRDANALRGQLRDIDAQNAAPPPPLTLKDVQRYLHNLRGLLNQEVPAAAEAIRTLTGRIKIRQELIAGRKTGARWIATFSPDLIRLLARIATQQEYPDSVTLEYLSRRIWTTSEESTVVIESTPEYERLASIYRQMQADGMTVNAIATAHGKSWEYVNHAIRFATTGERPKPGNNNARNARRRRWRALRRAQTGANGFDTSTTVQKKSPKYKEIAHQVAELRDSERCPFRQIAKRLGVSLSTVTKAYDHAHPEVQRSLLNLGKRPKRGTYCRLGEEIYRQIRDQIRQGRSNSEIAKLVNCGISTVQRERTRLREG